MLPVLLGKLLGIGAPAPQPKPIRVKTKDDPNG